MTTDATTLYKLIILYMLDKVNFPLSNSQISEFILDHQYTNYFTIQEVISALVSDNFISVLSYRNSTQYKLTSEGAETISFFANKISPAIREDIDTYLRENSYELRCETNTISDYYRTTNGEYMVHCLIREGNNTLIELNVSVPLEKQADSMCARWKDSSQEIYDYVMHKML